MIWPILLCTARVFCRLPLSVRKKVVFGRLIAGARVFKIIEKLEVSTHTVPSMCARTHRACTPARAIYACAHSALTAHMRMCNWTRTLVATIRLLMLFVPGDC
jgi:hypothetical protein